MHIAALILLILFAIFISLALFLLCGSLYIIYWKYGHWQRHRLPFVPAKFPRGSFQYGGGDVHVTELLLANHFKFKEITPIYGTYTFFVPTLTLTSLDLTKEILVKDFQCFHDRFSNYVVKNDHLTRNLVRLEGDEWKNLRRKLSPTFTSGQMKYMFPSMVAIAEKAAGMVRNDCGVKEFMVRYATDVIAKCIFGLAAGSLEDPKDTFTKMGKKIVRVNRPKSFLMSRFPALAGMFRMTLFDQEASDFYTKVVRETLAYRQKEHVRKKDFIDILMQEEDFTVEEITAQLVVFYTAGMDNASSILTFALIEMAMNADIQERARESASDCSELTYEAVMSMTYLDQIINETLRRYPPSPIITRNTTKDYKVPGLEYLTITKGTRVIIPIYCFHHDPENFPDPQRFDPDRFTADTPAPKAFFPFGDGPRSCLASRFGLLQVKICLAVLLRKYQFTVSDKTKIPIEINPKVPMFHTKTKVYLDWHKLE